MDQFNIDRKRLLLDRLLESYSALYGAEFIEFVGSVRSHIWYAIAETVDALNQTGLLNVKVIEQKNEVLLEIQDFRKGE